MVIRLRDLAVEDRPRERLLREGPLALSDVELLAVVLGTGRGSTEDALGLAHRILERASPLRDRSADELGEIPGVGPVKIARIAAALELGRRNPDGRRRAFDAGGKSCAGPVFGGSNGPRLPSARPARRDNPAHARHAAGLKDPRRDRDGPDPRRRAGAVFRGLRPSARAADRR